MGGTSLLLLLAANLLLRSSWATLNKAAVDSNIKIAASEANHQLGVGSKAATPADQGKPPQATGALSLIAVLGERHSGTNFMWRLLRTNLAAKINVTDTFCDYKHRYQMPGSHCPDVHKTLVIVMFRNPYDWALAMHDQCWCGGDEAPDEMQALDLDQFLRIPWHDTMRLRSQVASSEYAVVGGLTPGDPNATYARDTMLTRCGTLLQCRAQKYLNFVNISAWAPNVVYVRHEDVITPTQSLKWLASLVKRYRLPQANNTLHAIEHYKRRAALKFNADAAKTKSLWFNPGLARSMPQLQHFMAQVTAMADPEAEAKVGYRLPHR